MKHSSFFSSPNSQKKHHWGIIIAGGEGTRLQQFIQSKFGESRPKQYCALIGKRSLLRHTIDRVESLFENNHLLTTINAHHIEWAQTDLSDRSSDTIVIQPYNRETGPGLLLPLLHVHHTDPDAVVAVFPSDHLILEEDRCRSYVMQAIKFVETHRDHVIALGVAPNGCRHGYGWIEKGERLTSDGLYSVKRFWEKPDIHRTRHLYEQGCILNTMILIGSSRNFIKLLEVHMNEIFVPLQRIESSFGTPHEYDVTEEAFKKIPVVNFSKRILEHCPHNLSVLHMDDVYWNDWGDEVSVRRDIEYLEHLHDGVFDERTSQYDGMIV